ncbi:MAG: hypothetical protein N0C88_01355 [Candidatus Thiodiazotropha lotti]|uniref:Uncharacterized protein n=1 Tax=Candidatus Thiodiazotropha lotti TaxID=2792787 RepID=A0A9E4K194_9GAMM|nr:hypothetical protein [Candidatus Thiodiazotropha endoloripes]MCG7937492.1 hypothetical protein [Candidatus Thiodiazotropha lotti]MCW4201958.1 hypothetical protein [Candidatus Thiodiazotropha lotti]
MVSIHQMLMHIAILLIVDTGHSTLHWDQSQQYREQNREQFFRKSIHSQKYC